MQILNLETLISDFEPIFLHENDHCLYGNESCFDTFHVLFRVPVAYTSKLFV